jgi:DNA-binding transcriptional ArsR family regulator
MSDNLDLVFSALADPTRRAILARLTLGEASVAELAEPFDISPRAISLHVGVLAKAGLVSRSRDAQRRPARLVLGPLREVDDWLNAYRRLWEERLDRMEDVLRIIKRKGRK